MAINIKLKCVSTAHIVKDKNRYYFIDSNKDVYGPYTGYREEWPWVLMEGSVGGTTLEAIYSCVENKFISQTVAKREVGRNLLYFCDSENKQKMYYNAKYVKIIGYDRIVSESAILDSLVITNRFLCFRECGHSQTVITTVKPYAKCVIPIEANIKHVIEMTSNRGVIVILEKDSTMFFIHLDCKCNIDCNIVSVPAGVIHDKIFKISPHQKLISVGNGKEKHAVLIDTQKKIALKFLPGSASSFISIMRGDLKAVTRFNRYINIETFFRTNLKIVKHKNVKVNDCEDYYTSGEDFTIDKERI